VPTAGNVCAAEESEFSDGDDAFAVWIRQQQGKDFAEIAHEMTNQPYDTDLPNASALGKIIQDVQAFSPSTSSLELNNCKKTLGVALAGSPVQRLCDALLQTHHVREINLSCNNFGDPGAIRIADVIKKSPSITNVNLASCKIGDEGIYYLTQVLKMNDVVKILNVGNVSLDLEDAEYSNTISNMGARVIAQMIVENTAIKKLMMSNLRGVTDDGAHALMAAVRSGKNKTLTDLYLENSVGVTSEKRDQLREGNKSESYEEGSLLSAATDADPDDQDDARLNL